MGVLLNLEEQSIGDMTLKSAVRDILNTNVGPGKFRDDFRSMTQSVNLSFFVKLQN